MEDSDSVYSVEPISYFHCAFGSTKIDKKTGDSSK